MVLPSACEVVGTVGEDLDLCRIRRHSMVGLEVVVENHTRFDSVLSVCTAHALRRSSRAPALVGNSHDSLNERSKEHEFHLWCRIHKSLDVVFALRISHTLSGIEVAAQVSIPGSIEALAVVGDDDHGPWKGRTREHKLHLWYHPHMSLVVDRSCSHHGHTGLLARYLPTPTWARGK